MCFILIIMFLIPVYSQTPTQVDVDSLIEMLKNYKNLDLPEDMIKQIESGKGSADLINKIEQLSKSGLLLKKFEKLSVPANSLYEAEKLKNEKKYDQAIELASKGLGELGDKAGSDPVYVSCCINMLNQIYEAKYAKLKAENRYNKIIDIYKKKYGNGFLGIAMYFEKLGELKVKHGKYTKAEMLYKRALKIYEDLNVMLICLCREHLGDLYEESGKKKLVEPTYLIAMEEYKKFFGKVPARFLGKMSDYYESKGKFAKAELFYREELILREKELGESNIKICRYLDSFAGFLMRQKKFTEANSLCYRSYEIKKKVLDPNHMIMIESHIQLSEIYRELGKYSQCEEKLKLLLSKFKKSKTHTAVFKLLTDFGRLYSAQDNKKKADQYFYKALEYFEKKVDKEDRFLVTQVINQVADYFMEKGNYKWAEKLYNQELRAIETNSGKHSEEIAKCLDDLVKLNRSIGHKQEADKLEKRAVHIRALVSTGNDLSDPFFCWECDTGEKPKSRKIEKKNNQDLDLDWGDSDTEIDGDPADNKKYCK